MLWAEMGVGGAQVAMESVYKSPADLDKNAGPSLEDGVGLRVCVCCFSKAGQLQCCGSLTRL